MRQSPPQGFFHRGYFRVELGSRAVPLLGPGSLDRTDPHQLVLPRFGQLRRQPPPVARPIVMLRRGAEQARGGSGHSARRRCRCWRCGRATSAQGDHAAGHCRPVGSRQRPAVACRRGLVCRWRGRSAPSSLGEVHPVSNERDDVPSPFLSDPALGEDGSRGCSAIRARRSRSRTFCRPLRAATDDPSEFAPPLASRRFGPHGHHYGKSGPETQTDGPRGASP